MEREKILISDFVFEPEENGFKVTYTSPFSKKQWTETITDMELINLTKNEESPKRTHLERLKRACKHPNITEKKKLEDK